MMFPTSADDVKRTNNRKAAILSFLKAFGLKRVDKRPEDDEPSAPPAKTRKVQQDANVEYDADGDDDLPF